jgi:hypothetical protein
VPAWIGLASIVLVVNTFFTYAGIEVNAVHVDELRDPGREYPKAMFLATLVDLALFILPTLAISWVIPTRQISLTAGVMQAFDSLLRLFDLAFAVPVVAVALAVGALARMMAWLDGPAAARYRSRCAQAIADCRVPVAALEGNAVDLVAVELELVYGLSGRPDSVLAQRRHRQSSAVISAQQGEDSRRIVSLDASRFGQLVRRGGGSVAHQQISLVVRLRQVRIAGVGRTVRAPWSECHPLAGHLELDGVGPQLPARAAATRDDESPRLAYALPKGGPSA